MGQDVLGDVESAYHGNNPKTSSTPEEDYCALPEPSGVPSFCRPSSSTQRPEPERSIRTEFTVSHATPRAALVRAVVEPTTPFEMGSVLHHPVGDLTMIARCIYAMQNLELSEDNEMRKRLTAKCVSYILSDLCPEGFRIGSQPYRLTTTSGYITGSSSGSIGMCLCVFLRLENHPVLPDVDELLHEAEKIGPSQEGLTLQASAPGRVRMMWLVAVGTAKVVILKVKVYMQQHHVAVFIKLLGSKEYSFATIDDRVSLVHDLAGIVESVWYTGGDNARD